MAVPVAVRSWFAMPAPEPMGPDLGLLAPRTCSSPASRNLPGTVPIVASNLPDLRTWPNEANPADTGSWRSGEGVARHAGRGGYDGAWLERPACRTGIRT